MQLNVTKRILIENMLDILVVSGVKDERHKPKALLGDKVLIQKYKNQILLANNEAHRFAIFSHRINRKNNFTQSALDTIDGIGKRRKKLLLNHFGSVKLIENASVEDIKKIEDTN